MAPTGTHYRQGNILVVALNLPGRSRPSVAGSPGVATAPRDDIAIYVDPGCVSRA
jgi:hypothetical protein